MLVVLTSLDAHPLAVQGVCAVRVNFADLVGCWWLNIFGGTGTGLTGTAVFALNSVVDFLPVHRNGLRRLDAEANFVAADVDDGNHDIITDHDAFVAVS